MFIYSIDKLNYIIVFGMWLFIYRFVTKGNVISCISIMIIVNSGPYIIIWNFYSSSLYLSFLDDYLIAAARQGDLKSSVLLARTRFSRLIGTSGAGKV